jgi:hypothetical protein
MFFLLFLVFPLIYISFYGNVTIISHDWGAAYKLSLQQLFRPFEIYSARFSAKQNELPFSLYLVATLQSMVNVGLFTLFILAIRGRFRMY